MPSTPSSQCLRWPFLVPCLADTCLDPASSGATREPAVVMFESFNRYAGVAVGESLGYLFTAIWTGLVALALLGSALPFRRWLSLLGGVSAAAILVGTLEPAGFDAAADNVVVGYILWSVWLIAFGALVLRTRSLEDRAPRAHPAGSPTGEREPLSATLP